MLIGFAASFCIEAVQFITRLGFADIDDLMNNTIGAGIGYLLYRKRLTHVVNIILRTSRKGNKAT